MTESGVPLLRVDGDRLEKLRKRLRAETDAIDREREEAERRAGLDTKRLREEFGSFSRVQIRREYFAVTDSGLRDELIDLDRREHDALVRFWDICIADAERALAKEKYRAERPPWTLAAFCAGLCVAIGYAAASLPGANGAAVVGFFMGQGVISRAQPHARTEIEAAQRELDAERAERHEVAVAEIFSLIESMTNEPDPGTPERADFDRSAT
jgi:hypothetical protein